MLRTDFVEGGEDLLLNPEVLEHCLDHEVGIWLYALGSHSAGDSPLDLLDVGGAEDPALHGLVEEASDDLVPAVDPLLLAIDHLDIEALLSALLGDAGAHIACADDCDGLDGSHEPSREKPTIYPTDAKQTLDAHLFRQTPSASHVLFEKHCNPAGALFGHRTLSFDYCEGGWQVGCVWWLHLPLEYRFSADPYP